MSPIGRKLSDGKAINLTVPDSEVVLDYELYRIDGVNGLAVGAVASTDTDRTLAFECDTNAIYRIHVPTAVNPSAGDLLYWDDPSSFQSGPDDLLAAASAGGDAPCFWVTEARASDGDGGYVLSGRVLNGVTGDATS